MIILLSPSKGQAASSFSTEAHASTPLFLDQSDKLIKLLKKMGLSELKSTMKISDKIAERTHDQHATLGTDLNPGNAHPALFFYSGDVYSRINCSKYDTEDLSYAQNQLRILSGLYGMLRPLDLIQAYRLEMACKIAVGHSKNLYQFWTQTINKQLALDIAQSSSSFVLNLASIEYSKLISPKILSVPLIDVQFRVKQNGQLKNMAIFAKRARGFMTDYLIKNKARTIDDVKAFAVDGYHFIEALSGKDCLFFSKDG
jgi:uncharacterized protein